MCRIIQFIIHLIKVWSTSGKMGYAQLGGTVGYLPWTAKGL